MPIVVHATFQRDENPGKLSRFREWNWWLQVGCIARLPWRCPASQSAQGMQASELIYQPCHIRRMTTRMSPLQDPPAYYSEGNFMSYGNGVRDFIDRTQAGYRHGTMTRFHQHQLAAAYQLAAFQHALAIARCHADAASDMLP
jgi:hypothetical protein